MTRIALFQRSGILRNFGLILLTYGFSFLVICLAGYVMFQELESGNGVVIGISAYIVLQAALIGGQWTVARIAFQNAKALRHLDRVPFLHIVADLLIILLATSYIFWIMLAAGFFFLPDIRTLAS